jgi:hypothetical protein
MKKMTARMFFGLIMTRRIPDEATKFPWPNWRLRERKAWEWERRELGLKPGVDDF